MFKSIDPKPDFPKLEEEILKFWEENKIFEKSLEQTKDGLPYTFYDGPPFATGTPHYGHILGSTVKDLFPRYQTMKGRFVRRRWGWDCHGLPIEEIVERKLGISGKKDIEKLGIKKFNDTCRSMVLEYVSEWRKTIRRIARWVDFDNSYKTMDRDYMESVWWAFKQIYDKGLIYEGRRVLLYCPRCETPISNFEVAMDNSYKEVTEEAVTVKFKVKSKKSKVKIDENTYLLAWTTTPWTLPGNVALAVGQDINYVQIEVGGEQYILAKERLERVVNDKFQITNDKIKGRDLIGLEYEPLFDVPAVQSDKTFKVYAADFVNTEEGTGIVHTAVVYGEDDYNLGLKVGLPVVPLLDEKGIFMEDAPYQVRGMYFKDSEKVIKKDLESRGLVFAKQQHKHSYPHCWRCGTTLFYNAIPAWFMNIQKIKSGLLETNEQMNWYPEHLKHGRYEKSVEAAPDWNISRNRYWGNPIPVWRCDSGHNTVVGSIKELGLSKNTFYFARHAESSKNTMGIVSCSLANDKYDLTDLGRKEAEQLAVKSKTLGVNMIFTSDYLRTKHTAKVVANALGLDVNTDARLEEYNVGVFEGKDEAEYQEKFLNLDRWVETPEEGENWTQIKDRVVAFINEINSKYKGKKILIVSHGDPLWVIQQYYGSERSYPLYADIFELDVSITDLHRSYIDDVVIKCKECGKDAHRITEIFDSWVEAGSMPFAAQHYPFDTPPSSPPERGGKRGGDQKNLPFGFPAQFVSEYIAQTRAWFYVMHVIAFNLFGKAPFEHVVTSGTIMAEDWSKLSKSKKNYPDPWKVIDQFGVDALRFYLMNSPVMQADNMAFSEKELGITYRKNILILWNVLNYFVTYANESGWNPNAGGVFRFKNVFDHWIMSRLSELIEGVTENMDRYDTVRATRLCEEFINDLSTWYLRRNRGRKEPEFFMVLQSVLLTLSEIMAPITPYISEIIHRTLYPDLSAIPSVHLFKWPETKWLPTKEPKVLQQMQVVRNLVEQGHSLRKGANIRLRQPLASFTYTGDKLEKEYEEILADELNVESVKFGDKLEFDLNITPELRKQGLAAELERTVQDMRKRTGLKVGQLVDLSYNTDDEELIVAFELFDTKKTYIREIKSEGKTEGEEVEIDGRKINIEIK